jgi:predicted kinase
LSGTGKSLLARALAPRLVPDPGAVVVRSDIERKRLFGVGETDPLGAHAYSAEATAQVYAAMLDQARRIIAAGHSAILDAVFARGEERDAAAALARRHNVTFRGVFLVADLATRVARVAARQDDASDADAQVARRQEDYQLGALDWTKLDASGTPEQTLAAAMGALT